MNDHGWGPPVGTVTGGVLDGGVVFVAPSIDERKRCTCPRDSCRRPATQEDLRCDECRETCR